MRAAACAANCGAAAPPRTCPPSHDDTTDEGREHRAIPRDHVERVGRTFYTSNTGGDLVGNPRRANGHRRNQLRARVLREEDHCALCGQPVDKTLKTPHPGSPEVDEIIRVKDGGDPLDRANCRLTHRHCNRYRDVKKPDIPTVKRVRQW